MVQVISGTFHHQNHIMFCPSSAQGYYNKDGETDFW